MGAELCATAGGMAQDAGGDIGSTLLDKGKSMAGGASQKLLERIEETLDDKVERVINEKLSSDSAFGKTIDSFVDKTFDAAMQTFGGGTDETAPAAQVDEAQLELQRKQQERQDRLKKAVERLRDIGMPQLLIDRMEQNGWLDERNWELLTKDQLLSMGFALGHIELFMDGVNKIKLAKRIASEKLKRWLIPGNLINAMESRGYLDESKWPELRKEALEWERRERVRSKRMDPRMREECEQKSRLNVYLELEAKKDRLIRENAELARKVRSRSNSVADKLKHHQSQHLKLKDGADSKRLDKPVKVLVQYEPYWEPYKGIKLKEFGFEYKHIESFLAGLVRAEEQGQPPEFVLYKWGIPRNVIERMREERVLSENKWDHLSDDRLKELGFTTGNIEIFKIGLSERSKLDQSEVEQVETVTRAEEELRSWGIPPVLVDRMKEVGWVHPEFWDDLLEHDYELESLGFLNGHISTFKRKFREYKEKQDSNETQRKMKLLRKLEKPPKKQMSLLKRNIDVCNATDEPIKVRIIGERKYGTMESSSGAQSAASGEESSRNASKTLASKNKQVQDNTNESTSDETKDRSYKVSAAGTAGPTPVNIGIDVGVTKKDTLSKTHKATAHKENEQESQQSAADARRNLSNDASAQSQANASQHSWEKVTVGFIMVMPGQTLEFPVQISDPNAVVYLTMYALSKPGEPVSDNVQLDANFVKVEKVRIEGFGTHIKLSPGVKPPKTKDLGTDAESLAAKQGIFTMIGFCAHLELQGIDLKKIDFLLAMLRDAQYIVDDKKGEMDVLKADLRKVLQIYEQRTEHKNDDDDLNQQPEVAHKNEMLKKFVQEFLAASKSIVTFEDTVADEQKASNAAAERKDKAAKRRSTEAAMEVRKLCDFLRNKGIANNKKIDFIQESLGGKDALHMLSGDTAQFEERVDNIIKMYDELDEFKLKQRHVINSSNYEQKIEEYEKIVRETKQFHDDHAEHQVKYEKFEGHRDDDSDDEELNAVEKFFDVDSYSLLKTWDLEMFHERMVDEGWRNPLDWVHLDDYILKQNMGFRPGHIQIFNRKFDLWVKRYNDVRRTIDPKRKGKDGVLIVGKDSITTLKSNFLYEFTKVIVRENGTLTVQPWSPTKKDGGVLFIKSYQEIILEKNARISVDGKGQWGSRKPNGVGFGNGGGGSVFVSCNGAGGASYATKGWRGYDMTQDEDFEHIWKVNSGGGAGGGGLIPEEAASDGGRGWGFFADPTMANYVPLKSYDYFLTHRRNSITQLTKEQEQEYEDDNPYDGEAGDHTWFLGDQSRRYKTLEDLDINPKKTFPDNRYATKDAKEKHENTLGGGGGCSVEIFRNKWKWSTRPRRGGSGGGAVRIWCDRLVMYEDSQISAKGEFDPYGDPLSGGGSGGAIFLTVTSEISPKNRDPENLNISLNARGGGQEDMDRMYLEHTWTDAEKDALTYIRTFEKLILPYLEITKLKQKEEEEAERRLQRDNLANYLDKYIDSDDEDDYESDKEKNLKDDDEKVEQVEQESVAAQLSAINATKDKLEQEQEQIDDADVMEEFDLEQEEWDNKLSDEQREAMRNKYKMKKKPIAQQLAMIKREFFEFLKLPQDKRETFKNAKKIPSHVRYINEKDLWLWKWKKMPKFNPFEDEDDNGNANDKEKRDGSRKSQSGSGASTTKTNVSVKKKALDDNFSGNDSSEYEWVGIGGSGVIRVDYHSPFSVGWGECQPEAYLGTDTKQLDEAKAAQQTENVNGIDDYKKAGTIHVVADSINGDGDNINGQVIEEVEN